MRAGDWVEKVEIDTMSGVGQDVNSWDFRDDVSRFMSGLNLS